MFNPTWVIRKKRDGKELTREEIRSFVAGLTNGEVTDYHATAFLMATYFKGMTVPETVALTESMLESGDRYRFDDVAGPKVDKHSTGGVGDKVSLILAPLAAACGVKVPMMSGRGLGHSGGTLDKLESIPGFDVRIGYDEFKKILRDVGCGMIGQTSRIAPADRVLYSLRDVTSTVECIPLIVASILSKKLAEGTDSLVLDVKTGSGAFMKTMPQARALTQALALVARKMGLKCRALITDMNQPLGYAVGNALEMYESIGILNGEILKGVKRDDLDSSDLIELTLQTCAHMVQLGGVTKTLPQAYKLARSKLEDGSAWRVFQALCKAQDGDLATFAKDAPAWGSTLYPTRRIEWRAPKSGYLNSIETENIGRILVAMGGGRKKAADSVDFGVGMLFHKKLGAKIRAGETLVTAFVSPNHSEKEILEFKHLFDSSIKVDRSRKPVPKLILAVY